MKKPSQSLSGIELGFEVIRKQCFLQNSLLSECRNVCSSAQLLEPPFGDSFQIALAGVQLVWPVEVSSIPYLTIYGLLHSLFGLSGLQCKVSLLITP